MGTLIPVSQERIGIPSSTLSPSPIGIPKSVGSHHGASGAQFRGVAIQLHPPKPQLSHSMTVSSSSEISSTVSFSSFIVQNISASPSCMFGSISSLSGIPSLSLSL